MHKKWLYNAHGYVVKCEQRDLCETNANPDGCG